MRQNNKLGQRVWCLRDGKRREGVLRWEDETHVLILGDEPAWPHLRAELRRFLPASETAEDADQGAGFDDLTEREREVLELIAQGLGNDDIAQRLAISEKTVRNHITNIFGKLAATTRAQAIVRARQAGFGGL